MSDEVTRSDDDRTAMEERALSEALTVIDGGASAPNAVLKSITITGFKSMLPKTTLEFAPGITAVIGPNGSGKCLPGSSRVTLADGRDVAIRDLVDAALRDSSSTEVMDDGLLTRENPHAVRVVSLDTKSLKLSARSVAAFVRRTAPPTLLRICTRSGRSVTVTPYHPLFMLDNGRLREARADEVQRGLRVAVPRRLPTESGPHERLLPTPLTALAERHDVFASSTAQLEQWREAEMLRQGGEEAWMRAAGMPEVRLTAGKSMSVSTLSRLSAVSSVPAPLGTTLASRTDGLARYPSRLTPDLARFLGLWLAEGDTTRDGYRVDFVNADEAVTAEYARMAAETFGVKIKSRSDGGPSVWTFMHSRVVAAILESLFGARFGQRSAEKTIPGAILTAGPTVQWAFLSGLFEGDAHVCVKPVRRASGAVYTQAYIEYSTASERMAHGVVALLLRLGLFASVRCKVKCATNTVAKTMRPYWSVYLYGAWQLQQAACGLSFVGGKQRALDALADLDQAANPNLDVIPGATTLVKEAARIAGVSVKRHRRGRPKLAAYVEGRCDATRSGLHQVVYQIAEVGEHPRDAHALLEELLRLSASDVYWDEVVSVEEIAPTDPWVYDLCVDETHNFVADNVIVHNSNVADAIRWALGENNARILRAKRNDELIFAGSETRRGTGMAEVTLHLDNSSRRLPVDFTELEVGRRLFKSGEAEYLVNRSRVRLRDLQDLLAGANLADNPFVVIGQGLVDQVLALRPADRRTVIEEAAGTRRLHLRREDALNRLKSAEVELVRVIDILREIGPRVALLEEQAGKWTEYEVLRNELRRRALRWYRSSFGETATARADLVAKLQSVEREIERLADYVTESEGITAGSDDELRLAREEEERRRLGAADAVAAESGLRERIAALQAAAEASAAERDRTRSVLASLPAEAAALRQRRAAVDEEAASAVRLAREAADRARTAEVEASRTRVALAEAQAARVEALLAGEASALRDSVERAERDLAEHETVPQPQLPSGMLWLREHLTVDAALAPALLAALGDTAALALTRSAVLGVKAPGLTVVVPDDLVEVRTPAGCERLMDHVRVETDLRPVVEAALHNVFLAPDRRSALEAARGLLGGLVVAPDGFAARPGLVRTPQAQISSADAANARLRAVLEWLRTELVSRAGADGTADAAKAIEAVEQAERDATEAHAAASKRAEEARLESATSEERRASHARLRDALDEQVSATERRLADEEERLRALVSQERETRARLEAAHGDLGTAQANAREALRSAELARERALAAEGSRRESEQRLAKARERLAELRGERSKLAVEEERASGALRLLEEQVRAELGLPDDEPLPDPASLDVGDEGDDDERTSTMRELQRLRRRLIALEPVNPLAATELAEIGERHRFLASQRADLEKAIADLRSLADELATAIAEQFSATFQAVDREFASFFAKLFGGGQASLRTSDDPDEPGIDIYARPPGKRLGSLQQLSGGERALTATALLLAILRVKPAPFCVLDEVDAALDERNVGRFTQALRELTDRTQFVVITHNRTTIEAADTLYGVSMDESGVSKVISLRLAELDERAG